MEGSVSVLTRERQTLSDTRPGWWRGGTANLEMEKTPDKEKRLGGSKVQAHSRITDGFFCRGKVKSRLGYAEKRKS